MKISIKKPKKEYSTAPRSIPTYEIPMPSHGDIQQLFVKL
jgi:hypothetical protein